MQLFFNIQYHVSATVYDDPQQTTMAETTLHALQQGRRADNDYVMDFRYWSADTDWNDAALHHQFYLGLSESLKDELAWLVYRSLWML